MASMFNRGVSFLGSSKRSHSMQPSDHRYSFCAEYVRNEIHMYKLTHSEMTRCGYFPFTCHLSQDPRHYIHEKRASSHLVCITGMSAWAVTGRYIYKLMYLPCKTVCAILSNAHHRQSSIPTRCHTKMPCTTTFRAKNQRLVSSFMRCPLKTRSRG